jgi:hypothetical protein
MSEQQHGPSGAPQPFSITWRQEVLDRVLRALAQDTRLAGTIVVGSGAVGFEDRYSDIDLCAVVDDGEDALAVFRDWRARFESLLPIVHCAEVIYGRGSYLWGLLLEGLLELDAGFVDFDNLAARRPRWTVVFDRSGRVESIMRSSSAESAEEQLRQRYLRRLDSVWHFIVHVVVAVKRAQPWRALHYLETLRNRTIELAGLRWQLDTGRFRQVDKMPPEFLSVMESTLVAAPDAKAIVRALGAATDCFFEQAKALDAALGISASKRLGARMREFVDTMGLDE